MEKLKEPKKPRQLKKPLPPEETIEVAKEFRLDPWDHDVSTLAQILELEGFKDIPNGEIHVYWVDGYHDDQGYHRFVQLLRNLI